MVAPLIYAGGLTLAEAFFWQPVESPAAERQKLGVTAIEPARGELQLGICSSSG